MDNFLPTFLQGEETYLLNLKLNLNRISFRDFLLLEKVARTQSLMVFKN